VGKTLISSFDPDLRFVAKPNRRHIRERIALRSLDAFNERYTCDYLYELKPFFPHFSWRVCLDTGLE
jgi:hypothetical protein